MAIKMVTATYMKTLKTIFLIIIEIFGQIFRLPRTVAAVLKNRRRVEEIDVAEAERLDRIRHPSKYLGK